jgi:cyanophycin synthetase
MQILKTSVFVGPNAHARAPVIRMAVDFGRLEERSPADFMPDIAERLPDIGRGPLVEGQIGWAALLARIAAALQALAGCPVSIAEGAAGSDSRSGAAIFGYETEEIALDAADLALDLLAALRDRGHPEAEDRRAFDWATERDIFLRAARRRALGPSTAALVRAAEARGIPWFRLNDQSLIQFGHGRYQKRIEATLTSDCPQIAFQIASDKDMTNKVLGDLGLPVPRQRVVRSADDAVDAADRLGYPVVVKPRDGNHGRAVAINLTDGDAVAAAFDAAADVSGDVIVETMIRGFDHRLLVVDGELVAAARRMPGHVTGDGQLSVAALVDRENLDPRRGVGHENMLTQLDLDDQALRLLTGQGMTPDSVPAAGQIVPLRYTANLSTGGTAIDVTDIVHPDNKAMAERAIRAIGLDVGGIDFICTNIAESWRETGGAICEVNAGPGFRMHVAPSEGKPRDVAGRVVDMLFPPQRAARIPIAALTGTNGKTTTAKMLAHILKSCGHVVGQTATDAVYIDGTVTVRGDMTGPVAARMVLRDPSVDAAVLEVARGGIVRSGLGFDHCDVGAVLNVSSDHLGLGGVRTLDELARVKRVVVEAATGTAVLNADNPYTLAMADHCTARHICYVTRSPDHPLVREHIRCGCRALVLEAGLNGDMITIYEGGQHFPVIWTHLIPATLEGKALHNVENAMFAAAMARALGKSLDIIRHGLRTFDSSFFQSPGRLNVYDEHAFRAILDYGHNSAAIAAVCDTVDRMALRGRRIVAVTCPGDRRDEDIDDIAAVVAKRFDRYVCHRDDDLRERGPDEIPQKMRDALIAHGVDPDAIELVPEEERAVDHALGLAGADDLVLLFCENVTRTWKQIIYFRKDSAPPTGPRSRVGRAAPDIVLPPGARLVRDDRGVRLAAE